MLDRGFRILARFLSTGCHSIVATSGALLFALVGASSAQQVQWVQSPINGHWYGAEYSPRTWPNAEAVAVSLGGHLATVRNQSEQNWVQATFAPYSGGNDDFWIGYTDAASEAAWVWTSGDPATYTNWANLEPNGGTGENYCHMITWAGGLWNDNSPGHQFRSLIEAPVLSPRSWSWPSNVSTGLHPALLHCRELTKLASSGLSLRFAREHRSSTG